jgi:hypothetical protein
MQRPELGIHPSKKICGLRRKRSPNRTERIVQVNRCDPIRKKRRRVTRICGMAARPGRRRATLQSASQGSGMHGLTDIAAVVEVIGWRASVDRSHAPQPSTRRLARIVYRSSALACPLHAAGFNAGRSEAMREREPVSPAAFEASGASSL